MAGRVDLIYGRHAVAEALRAEDDVLEIQVAEGVKPRGLVGEVLSTARGAGIPVKWVPQSALDRTFRQAGGRGSHQGLVALLAEFEYADINGVLAEAIRREEPPFLVALDAVQDVHNLGNLIRTAEAVGVHGVVIPHRESARITGAVRNASAGAVAHTPVVRMDFLDALNLLRSRDIRVVGLDQAAVTEAFDADFTGPLAVVVGGEAQGLRTGVANRCELLVSLPMRGRIESLNAAVAGSIVLYEALRQRR